MRIAHTRKPTNRNQWWFTCCSCILFPASMLRTRAFPFNSSPSTSLSIIGFSAIYWGSNSVKILICLNIYTNWCTIKWCVHLTWLACFCYSLPLAFLMWQLAFFQNFVVLRCRCWSNKKKSALREDRKQKKYWVGKIQKRTECEWKERKLDFMCSVYVDYRNTA